MALLRSCACQTSAAWLTALPTAHALVLKTEEFRAALQHRLGLAPLTANAVGLPCSCRAPIMAADGEHLSERTIVDAPQYPERDYAPDCPPRWVAPTLEPTLRRLPGLQTGMTDPAGGGDIGRLEGWGAVLMALGAGMAVVDVSVTHPAGVAKRAAAAKRDVEKRRAYNRLEPNGYSFTPFSVETYGRFCKSAIALLVRLGVEAAGAAALGAVSKSAVVWFALSYRELSVALWATVSCTGKHWNCGLVGLGRDSCWALTVRRPRCLDECMCVCSLCVCVLAASCGCCLLLMNLCIESSIIVFNVAIP
jgi:hypothetical protein